MDAPESIQQLLWETLQKHGGAIWYRDLVHALECAWPLDWIPRGLDGEYLAEKYIKELCKKGLLHHDHQSEKIIITDKVSMDWLREKLQEAFTGLLDILPHGKEPVISTSKLVENRSVSLQDRDRLDILSDFAQAYRIFIFNPTTNGNWIPGAHNFFKDTDNFASILLGDQSWRKKASMQATRAQKRWQKEREKARKLIGRKKISSKR